MGVQAVGPLPAVAVAGVGAGMVLPAIARARTAARGVVSKSNLKQIGMGVNMYAVDHQGALPPDFDALFDGGLLEGDNLLIAPNDPTPQPVGKRPSSYVYLLSQQPGLKLTIAEIQKPAAFPLAWERQSFGGGVRNVVFCDGHVEGMTEVDFQRRLARVRNWLRKKRQDQKGEF
jgi:prepilin-type processing-associated H-X9-DG protein